VRFLNHDGFQEGGFVRTTVPLTNALFLLTLYVYFIAYDSGGLTGPDRKKLSTCKLPRG